MFINMDKIKLVHLVLRLSIASVFLYAAIASFIEPFNWIGYFPLFLRHLIPEKILLTGFSCCELVLAVWLLTGKRTFYAALLSGLTLIGIIVANFAQLDILFRDIAITFSAVALALLSYNKAKRN